jgi:hypothetical protein
MPSQFLRPETTRPSPQLVFRFLALPAEIRLAIYEHCVPAETLHISQTSYLPNDEAGDRIFSIGCRNVPDVEFIGRSFPTISYSDYHAIGSRVQCPGHIACVMLGVVCQPREHSGWLSLLQTSRTVRDEFLPVLYARPRFAFHEWGAFARFFSLVPRAHQARIRAIYIAWVGTGQTYDKMSTQWREIVSTIKDLPRPLQELEIFVAAPEGLRTPHKRLPFTNESQPLHESLRTMQVLPKGRFIVVEKTSHQRAPESWCLSKESRNGIPFTPMITIGYQSTARALEVRRSNHLCVLSTADSCEIRARPGRAAGLEMEIIHRGTGTSGRRWSSGIIIPCAEGNKAHSNPCCSCAPGDSIGSPVTPIERCGLRGCFGSE